MVGFGCAIAAFIAIRACPARKTVILTLGGIGLGLCVISAGVNMYYIMYLRCVTCRYAKKGTRDDLMEIPGWNSWIVESSCPGYCVFGDEGKRFIEKHRG